MGSDRNVLTGFIPTLFLAVFRFCFGQLFPTPVQLGHSIIRLLQIMQLSRHEVVPIVHDARSCRPPGILPLCYKFAGSCSYYFSISRANQNIKEANMKETMFEFVPMSLGLKFDPGTVLKSRTDNRVSPGLSRRKLPPPPPQTTKGTIDRYYKPRRS